MITSSFISSASLADETLRSMATLQKQLVDAQKEIATGNHADIGLSLGATTGTAVSMRQDVDQIQAIKNSNDLVLNRLTASQSALSTISTGASNFLASLISSQSAATSPDTLIQASKAGMQTLQDQLNTSLDGQYLFAGTNSDVQPMQDFFAAPATAGATAIQTVFQATFGFPPSDPQVANITPDQMTAFLNDTTPNKGFASLFTASSWSGSTGIWTAASSKPVSNRISRSEVINTSVTATDPTFSSMAEAFAMISGLPFANLNQGTQQAVISKARDVTANVTGSIVQVQSGLGVTQQRITDANNQIDTQVNFLSKSIDNLEQVDTAAVTTQLSQISTALQAAYSLTSRLNNLSILNYLPNG